MWLQPCIHLTLGFLPTAHLINGDQWQVSNTVPEACILDRTYAFSLQGQLYPCCQSQICSCESTAIAFPAKLPHATPD